MHLERLQFSMNANMRTHSYFEWERITFFFFTSIMGMGKRYFLKGMFQTPIISMYVVTRSYKILFVKNDLKS